MVKALFASIIFPIALGFVFAADIPKDDSRPNTAANEYAKKSVGSTGAFAVTRGAWNAVGDWLHNFHDEILAGATMGILIVTGALAAYTARLWSATSRLVEGSDRAAQKQLRAYLSVKLNEVIFQNDLIGQRFVVTHECKNDGQTPAYEFSYHARADVFPYPLPDHFEFPLDTEVTSTGVIGPQGKFQLEAAVSRLLGRDQISVIRFGKTSRLYVYGTIDYRDAFGYSRYTNFCHSIRWRGDAPIGENTKHHNDAS